MVWNDPTTEQGIVQFVNDYFEITNTDYSLRAKARSANTWLEKSAFNLMSGSGYWQFDDSNYSNLPVFTTDLVSGQANYTLNNTYYSVIKVLIKDDNGDWIDLEQMDIQQEDATPYLTESNEAGVPRKYDIFGDQIALDRNPNYNSTGGLKIWVERRPDYYLGDDSTADNNQEPGIPSLFHKYIAYGVAYDYAERRNLPQVNRIKENLLQYEQDMRTHASRRNKGRKHSMSKAKINLR